MKKPCTSLPLNDDDENAVLDLSDEISPDGKLIVVGYEIHLSDLCKRGGVGDLWPCLSRRWLMPLLLVHVKAIIKSFLHSPLFQVLLKMYVALPRVSCWKDGGR